MNPPTPIDIAKIFTFCTLLNIGLYRICIIKRTIKFLTKKLIEEASGLDYMKKYDFSSLYDIENSGPFGALIGVIEREIYIYSLCTSSFPIFASVLTFKGFTGWLKLNTSDKGSTNQSVAEKTITVKDKYEDNGTLAKFYSYALGNFTSVLFSILIYQIVAISFTIFS